MKRKIKVEQILEKTNKRGQLFWVLREDGEGYFVWDQKLIEGVSEGDTVEIEHTQGQYPRVKELKILEHIDKKPEKIEMTKDQKIKEMFDQKREGINRSVALSTAMEIIKIRADGYKELPDKGILDGVLKMARLIKQWLDGKEPKL